MKFDLPVVTNYLKIESLCLLKFFQGSDKLSFKWNLYKGIMLISYMKDNEIVLLGRQGNLRENWKYSKHFWNEIYLTIRLYLKKIIMYIFERYLVKILELNFSCYHFSLDCFSTFLFRFLFLSSN